MTFWEAVQYRWQLFFSLDIHLRAPRGTEPHEALSLQSILLNIWFQCECHYTRVCSHDNQKADAIPDGTTNKKCHGLAFEV